MSQRFQIEDLIVQDNSGVVFRALDTESGRQVALRRFFPFGGRGGGLDAEERIAYGLAVKRFAGVSHPALRSVICGGCDPIDGMPFIATEWVEGKRLQTVIDRKPLAPSEAVNLLLKALEVCQFLSKALTEEAVWVETDLEAIVIGEAASGRGITFWIAPLRLLETSDRPRSFTPLITLTEEIMGWPEKVVSDPAARGLESWLKWMRGVNSTTSLDEAREMLITLAGKKPPTATKHLVHQTARPVVNRKKRGIASKFSIMAVAFLVLLALGASCWLLVERNEATLAKAYVDAARVDRTVIPDPGSQTLGLGKPDELEVTTALEETAAPRPRLSTSPEDAERRAAEFLQERQNSEQEIQARRLEIQKRGGVFEIGDGALLLEQKNAEVHLRGHVSAVQFSDKGKGATLYLEFSNSNLRDGVRGFVMRKNLDGMMTLAAFQKLIGKNIQLRGKVTTPTSRSRPEIEIKDIDSIQEVR